MRPPSRAAKCGAPRGAVCFVEKTPTNVYNFEALSRQMPELPLIHQLRDGRDVAGSLVRRGKTLFYAGSRWLYDTVSGLRARGRPSYLESRYEDLVADAAGTLRTILAHLGIEYDPCMLEASRESSASTYEEKWRDKRSAQRWQSTPGDPISAASVGKFRRDLDAEQLSTLYRIRLTARAVDELQSPVRTFAELLEPSGLRIARLARDGARPLARRTTPTGRSIPSGSPAPEAGPACCSTRPSTLPRP